MKTFLVFPPCTPCTLYKSLCTVYLHLLMHNLCWSTSIPLVSGQVLIIDLLVGYFWEVDHPQASSDSDTRKKNTSVFEDTHTSPTHITVSLPC